MEVFAENALFLPGERTLVVSDLQIGREQQLRRLGHNIKYQDARRMLRLLLRLVNQHGARRVVLNGDVKHEFSRISGQERRDVLHLLSRLSALIEVIIVRGNHDTVTEPLAREAGVPLVDSWREGKYFCVHGHREVGIPRGVRTIIIGHLHPAVVLDDGVRREKYKCFLVGKYRRRRLIVLPSFTQLADGMNVLAGTSNTPFLTGRTLRTCDVYVLADRVRYFGTVGRLHQLKG